MVLLTSVFSTTLTKRLEIRDRQCLSTSVRNHWGQADKEYAAWRWVGWVGYTPQKSNDAPLSTKRKSLMVQVWCVLVKDALTSLALLWVVIMMTLAWHYWCELRTERWYKKKKIIRVWSSPACVFFSIWCCVCARARWRPAQPNQLQAHNTRPMMLPVHADLPAESQKPPVEFLPKQLFATPSFFLRASNPLCCFWFRFLDLRLISPAQEDGSSQDVRQFLPRLPTYGGYFCLFVALDPFAVSAFFLPPGEMGFTVCWCDDHFLVANCNFDLKWKRGWSKLGLVCRRSRGYTYGLLLLHRGQAQHMKNVI